MGNISHVKTMEELREKYMDTYEDEKNLTRDCNTIWNFYHEMQPGDIIIACRGRKKIIGIGAVAEPKKVYYSEGEGKKRVGDLTDDYYSNFMKVNWEKKKIDFEKIVFAINTIYDIPEEKYNEIIKGKTPEDNEEAIEQQTEEQKTELYLEKHLQEIIVRNFDALFKNQMKLYVDEEGEVGKYTIIGINGKKIGEIDILAKELKTNSYVVIELKKGRESGKVVGQILTYMGWVKDNLCKEGQDVKGIIICKEEDERLTNAMKLVSDMIDLKFYKLNLELKG